VVDAISSEGLIIIIIVIIIKTIIDRGTTKRKSWALRNTSSSG